MPLQDCVIDAEELPAAPGDSPVLCPNCGDRNAAESALCQVCGEALRVAEPAVPIPPGTRLLGGVYSVGRLLGQGGFGITYLGTDVHLARLVAIKEFLPDGCRREGLGVVPGGRWSPARYEAAKGEFLKEGQALARFSHPGIVQVYSAFEENDTAYIVMEYVRGQSLLELLAAQAGRMEEKEAVAVISAAGRALGAVHQARLLHRDVKPENIMLGPEGRVVLIDFGTARELAVGSLKGGGPGDPVRYSPGYAPPEQYSRTAARGPQSDVYSLAATLYRLLTGETPVESRVRRRGVALTPVRQLNPLVSPHIARIVTDALSLEVERRPASVHDFVDRLAQELPAVPGPALRPPSGPARQRIEHATPVYSLAFSPNGKLLATGCEDGALRLWHVGMRSEVQRLAEHSGPILSLAFSPDGKRLASVSWDETIRLWDLFNGREARRLNGHRGPATCVAFTPDGRRVVTAGEDRTLRLWEAGSGRLLCALEGHTATVTSVAFSPDGGRLVSASEDGTMRVWRAGSTDAEAVLAGHGGAVWQIAFHPGGELLASASGDGTIRVWEVAEHRERARLEGHRGSACTLAVSPDGGLLGSGGEDRAVRLWELASGDLVATLQEAEAPLTAVAFSSDGRYFAAAGIDRFARVWKLESPPEC